MLYKLINSIYFFPWCKMMQNLVRQDFLGNQVFCICAYRKMLLFLRNRAIEGIDVRLSSALLKKNPSHFFLFGNAFLLNFFTFSPMLHVQRIISYLIYLLIFMFSMQTATNWNFLIELNELMSCNFKIVFLKFSLPRVCLF